MFSVVLVGSGSVSFDTDPQGNDTDSTDPDPQHCLLPGTTVLCIAVSWSRSRPQSKFFLAATGSSKNLQMVQFYKANFAVIKKIVFCVNSSS